MSICAQKKEGELYQRTQLDPILVIGRENLSLLRRPSWLKIELIIYKTRRKPQREDYYLEKEPRWDLRQHLRSAQFEKVMKESREKDQNEVKHYRQSLGYSDICLSWNHHLSAFRDGEKYLTHEYPNFQIKRDVYKSATFKKASWNDRRDQALHEW